MEHGAGVAPARTGCPWVPSPAVPSCPPPPLSPSPSPLSLSRSVLTVTASVSPTHGQGCGRVAMYEECEAPCRSLSSPPPITIARWAALLCELLNAGTVIPTSYRALSRYIPRQASGLLAAQCCWRQTPYVSMNGARRLTYAAAPCLSTRTRPEVPVLTSTPTPCFSPHTHSHFLSPHA